MFTNFTDRENAAVMDALEKKIRAARSETQWLNAGMKFLREGFGRNCLDDLNGLADLLGERSCLSERTLDGLFEMGEQTDRLVECMQREAAVDQGFRDAVIREFGERILSPERLKNRTVDMFGQQLQAN